jgi:ligand-binding sensor domain-containing protein
VVRGALAIVVSLFWSLSGCGLQAPQDIQDLALQGNTLWACGSSQVYRIDLSDNSIESNSFPCDHLLIGTNGWVWAYRFYGITAYDGKDWRDFSDKVPYVELDRFNFVSSTSDGAIWVSGRQLSRYDPQRDQWDVVISAPAVPTPTPGPPPPAFSISGVSVPGYIGPVFEATDGALWFSEHTKGLVRWAQDSKQIWGKSEGVSSLISTMFIQAHDRSIWVGTIDGVNRFQDGTWQSWNFPGASREDGEVLAILEDSHDRIWVSFESGLRVWDSGSSTWSEIGDFTIGYQKGEARTLFQASSGEIWICCHNDGAVKYDNGTLVNYPTQIVAFAETPDHRLFGGGEGLFVYNRQLDQWQPFPGK